MTVELKMVGQVAVITLNDPKSRNALTGESAQQLVDYLRQVDSARDAAALVIQGADGNFCSGADRKLLDRVRQSPGTVQNIEELEVIYSSFAALAALSVPTVAAVRGAAVGAGVNLAMAADVRVVSEDARMLSGFLKIGLHPGGGHFLMLDRQAGPQTAVAMALLGEQVSGVDLVRHGLAWEALSDGDVEARALALASGAGEPALVREATRTFRAQATSRQMSHDAASRAEQAAQLWSIARGDRS